MPLGDAHQQQRVRDGLLEQVPELRRAGAVRKTNYIRHYPDRDGVELTVGVSQSAVDCRLVLKGPALRLEEATANDVAALAREVGGSFLRRPLTEHRATFVIYAPLASMAFEDIVRWVERTLDGLIAVRGRLLD